MNDVLERFHRTLVEEIRAHRPSYLEGPFTVAEIYQNLVPYSTHRDRIGVEMNGDYEDALLRLLAGEGDYLALDSEHALRQLREELDRPHPNTGVYREFAAVDVRLNPDHLDLQGWDEASDEPTGEEGDGAEAPEDATSEGLGDLGGARRAADASGRDEGPAGFWSAAGAASRHEGGDEAPLAAPRPDDDPTGGDGGGHEDEDHGETKASEGESGEVDACRWCRAELPDHPHLNFCPFCGTDIRLIPCAQCGEEVEPGWRFCVSCGTEAEV